MVELLSRYRQTLETLYRVVLHVRNGFPWGNELGYATWACRHPAVDLNYMCSAMPAVIVLLCMLLCIFCRHATYKVVLCNTPLSHFNPLLLCLGLPGA